MSEGEYVDSLINEYEILLTQKTPTNAAGENGEPEILRELSVSSDWSLSGAREVLRLAEEYGAFMLRNALAIAVVLGKEDGSAGY
jgi:hypothetical protein